MAVESSQDYFNDNKGSYQFKKLSELINSFEVQSHDSESHLSGLPRHMIVLHAKAALKDIHRNTAKDFKALELELGNDFVFPLPQDYVDYIRVSVVNENNVLLPLDINTNLNISTTYLQDHDYNLMFDNNGNVLEANANNLTNRPYRSFNVAGTGNGGNFMMDTSGMSKNGEFTINQREGVIYFGSKLAGKSIVLEYRSDGVEWERIKETDITYHKDLDQALNDRVYFNCIERRKNVPANEKHRAKMQYKASAHQAKIKIANLDLRAIARVWRKGTVWVKS